MKECCTSHLVHPMMTVMVLFSHFVRFPARQCPPGRGAPHSSVIGEYCSHLEKLKHIMGTILEGVRALITSARVFAHANARVRVQAGLDLFRAHMTAWSLLKAELETVRAADRGEKRPGRFLSNTHEGGAGGMREGGGAHLCFSGWQRTHTHCQEKECKRMRTRALTSKLSCERKKRT